MRLLLVSSDGGHLQHLLWLEPWWRDHARTWVTFDTPATRAALRGERVVFAHHPTNRHLPNLARNARLAGRVLALHRPDLVVSPGAGVALPFLLRARALGVPTVFLEVFDRIDRPSLTGRLVAPFVDGLALQWPEQRAAYGRGDVLGPIRMILVLAGTHHQPFPRLLDAARALVDAGEEVVVQRGATPGGVAGAVVHGVVAPATLEALADAADAIVCHGGPGSMFLAWDRGLVPVVVPRDPARGEHVDDHQLRFVARLGDRVVACGGATDVVAAVRAARARRTTRPDPVVGRRFAARFGTWAEGIVAGRRDDGPWRATLRSLLLFLGSGRR